MNRGSALALFALCCSGCFGVPTPLAPGVRGSVGIPQNGVLTDGVELPVEGTGFRRYRPRSPNYWGNPRLISALSAAAATIEQQRPGGAPLVVGDISARHGGKIPGHRSHRTGRDVDLLWYVTTPAGAPVHSPGFVPIQSDGLAQVHGAETPTFVRIDLERMWLLVAELLRSDQIGVQWMFVSRDVEALLTDYARSRDESPELVWRAETVLLQPGDSSPHADHLHLRIACSPQEMAAGCDGGGPYWQWLPLPAQPRWLGRDELSTIASEDLLPGPT